MKTLITIIGGILLTFQLQAQVSAVYVGGPFTALDETEINELRASGFNTVILWAIHVDEDGIWSDSGVNFTDNDGNYIGDPGWSSQVALLKQQPTSIDRVELSISAAGRPDFEAIEAIINREGTGTESILYKAFKTLKEELGVDAINYDDESNYDAESTTAFSIMLADLGFKVTFVPFTAQSFWGQTYTDVEAVRPGAIDRVYLQGYAGGSGNQPATWNPSFGDLKIIHGLQSRYGNCSTGDNPEEMRQKFTNFKADLSGGFVWLDFDVKSCEAQGHGTLRDYASVINEVFEISPPAIGKASVPSPAHEATEISVDADLSWVGGSYDAVHSVYFGTTPTLSGGDLKGEFTTSSYDPGTLANNTVYYWRIDEKNSTGMLTGDTWSYTTEVTTPLPGVSTNPFPADMATGIRTDATLKWDAGVNTISYDVYFGKDNPPSFIGNQTGTSYTPSDVLPLTTYYWQVNSKNSVGTTTGAIWSYTTREPNIAPNATVTVSSEFNSSFSGAKLIDGIIGSAGTGEWASAGEQTPWAKLTWDNEVTIRKVVLYDRISGEDILSGVLEFGDGTTMNVGALPGNGTGLEINFPEIKTNSVEFRVLTADGPNIGMTEFEVFGLDEIGGKAAKPRLTKPGDKAIDVAIDVLLDWGFTKNADSYKVYLSKSSTITEGDLLNAVTATQLDVTGLKNNTTYYWRVDAVNFLGVTQSDVFSFTTEEEDIVTSIDSEDPAETIQIYPNPTKGRVDIGFQSDTAPVSLVVYSPLGNKVFEQTRAITNNKITLDLSQMASVSKGIYFLCLMRPDKQINRKIILE